jgi:uncharacterized protein with FMN-binding domain
VRRAIAAAVGTVAGLAALLHFKTTPLPAKAALGTTTTAPPAGAPPTNPAAPSGTTPTSSARSSTPTTSSGGRRVVPGTAVENQYGVVQVQVTLAGNRIVDVTPLQMPTDRPRSQFISEQAAPLLREEVLAAQSAQIDTIGGATFTSESYAESLQAALDAAKG